MQSRPSPPSHALDLASRRDRGGGHSDRDRKERSRSPGRSSARRDRERPRFSEDDGGAGANIDEFAPAAPPKGESSEGGGVSIAELLQQLERLLAKNDAERLRRFVDKIGGLLAHDAENRELLQLQQQAAAAVSSLDTAAAAAAAAAADTADAAAAEGGAAGDPSPAAELVSPSAGEGGAGAAAEAAEVEDWSKPPVRLLGTVVSFHARKGFGFVRPDDADVADKGQDIFVHKAAVQVEGGGHVPLVEGQRVSFELNIGEGGRKCAHDVRDPEGLAICAATDTSTIELRSHTESWRGLKDHQEDRWTGPEDLGELGQYFGIFDGHGGIFTPEYLARNMHKSLQTRCEHTMPHGARIPPPRVTVPHDNSSIPHENVFRHHAENSTASCHRL